MQFDCKLHKLFPFFEYFVYSGPLRRLLRHIPYKSTSFIGADKLISLLQHDRPTAVALYIHGLLPNHEVTIRIIDTAIVFASLLGLFQHNVFAALWTCHADLFKIRLGVPAFGKPGRLKICRGGRT